MKDRSRSAHLARKERCRRARRRQGATAVIAASVACCILCGASMAGHEDHAHVDLIEYQNAAINLSPGVSGTPGLSWLGSITPDKGGLWPTASLHTQHWQID